MKIIKKDYLVISNITLREHNREVFLVKKGLLINDVRFKNGAKLRIILQHGEIIANIVNCFFDKNNNKTVITIDVRYLSKIKRYKFKSKNSKKNRKVRTR